MALGSERNLVPVISRLSRQSKSIDEAIGLFESALAAEIGSVRLLVDLMEDGMSPSVARSAAAFMDSRQFPFRGLYTAPLMVRNRKVGRLIACFATFAMPDKSLPTLTSHVAGQLSEILARTGRAVNTLTMVGDMINLNANREAA